MRITLAITYYNNQLMLAEHFKYWNAYPEWLRDKVDIIIIDDGSLNRPAEEVIQCYDLYLNNISIYRIKQDIPQNTVGARNLAFKKAKDGWVFCTDIDHVVPLTSMANLVNGLLNENNYYFPNRCRMVSFDRSQPIGKHSDTFILTKKTFWEAGGYDEGLTKYYYNGPHYLFRHALKRVSVGMGLNNVWTLYYPPDLISDASPVNGKKKLKNPKIMSHGKPKDHLMFDWEQVL